MKRIALFDAKPNMVVANDVFSRTGSLLVKQGSVLTNKRILKLIKYGVPTIHIWEPFATMESSQKVESVEFPDVICWETRQEAEQVVQDIFHDAKIGNLLRVNKAKKVVEKIIAELVKNQNIIGKLTDIRILDDYTFAHSVNVCVLAISTGIAMGYTKLRLRELGIGALLHDIGKMKISTDIIKKPSRLDDIEYNEIKKHPIFGYDLLKDHDDVSSSSAMIALQHHERFSGNGYPHGVKKDEIHPYAKIVAVADVYDALTADRVYKNAVYPYEAIEVIIASGGGQFDPEVVRTFVENVSIYPVGSVVSLSTGETGVITQVNRSLPIRPTVRLITDADGRELDGNVEIDLMKHTTVFINKVLNFRN